MKMQSHWGQNPWRFSLKRHGVNPLSDENEKKPLRAKFMKILFEETLYKSTGDENAKPLREKSVKVLSKETQCKSFKGWKCKATEGNPWRFSLRRHGIHWGIKMKGHWGQNSW
jgi:hypothetical protein